MALENLILFIRCLSNWFHCVKTQGINITFGDTVLKEVNLFIMMHWWTNSWLDILNRPLLYIFSYFDYYVYIKFLILKYWSFVIVYISLRHHWIYLLIQIKDQVYIEFIMIILVYVGSAESEIYKLSSNLSLVCFIQFHKNDLGKGVNPFLLLSLSEIAR